MKLNIGAGDVKMEGFHTCDMDPLSKPDFLFDLENDVFPFEDSSVDVVVAHHVLEHLGKGYFHCIQELYRVCKHGAIIDIRVPHYRHDEFFDDPTHQRAITVNGLRLFSKKYNQMAREQNAMASRLADRYKVDFEVVEWDYIPSAKYRKEFEGQPKDVVEKYLKEHNNIIEQIWIKWVVVKDEQ
jgi:predicted SAM-dependent methyltransferase